MTVINALQSWYVKNCKSDVSMGIQITADSKGQWQVIIDLFDTDLETKDFLTLVQHKSDDNWVRCLKENQLFRGYGGLHNLEDIIRIFCRWVESDQIKTAQEI